MSESPSTPALRTERPIPIRSQAIAVVTAGFGQNLVLTTVSTFMLVYLLQYAKISTQGMLVVTAIITATKIIDAIADPIMGGIVDQTRTRWGKLRPYILFSAGPIAVLTVLLFSIPDLDEGGKLLWFGVVYLLWGFAYTVCDVPFWGLIGSAFPDPAARNKVVANVRAFGAISLGLATLGMPWLALALSFGSGSTDAGTTSTGWTLAVAVIALLGMSLFLLAFFRTRERDTAAARERVPPRVIIRTLVQNRPLLMVLIGSVLGFGRFIVQTGGAVFVVIAYGEEGAFTLIGAAIIAGMVLSSFAAPWLLRRIPSRTVAIGSSLAAAVIYVVMFFVGFESIVTIMVFIFLTGLTLGLFLVVQATMIADAVDDAEARTGVRNDGISFAMLTFVSKIMSALAVLAFGIVVVIAGYEDGVTVTPQMQQTVFIAITLVPAVGCVLSAVPFVFYKLTARAVPSG